jgi:hypothetical protein
MFAEPPAFEVLAVVEPPALAPAQFEVPAVPPFDA